MKKIIELIKFGYQSLKIKAIKTAEITPGIYAIKTGFVNMFLIKNENNFIAIDAGSNKKQVINGLEQLNISSLDITAVLLTHTHADHIAGLELFENATIYGRDEINSRNMKFEMVGDNQSFQIDKTKIIPYYMKGHSKDSVSFLINDKYLFVGDTMSFDKKGKADLFISRYNDSDELQKQDIVQLSKLNGIEYVFSSHFGFVAGGIVEK